MKNVDNIQQILFFFNRISPDTWTKVKAGVVLAPIALLYLLTYIISSNTILIIIAVLLFSLQCMVYAIFMMIDILKKETGSEQMLEIADAIREGSEGFFATQYSTIFKLSLVFGIAIWLFYFEREISPDEYITNTLGSRVTSFFVVFSFFLGAFCSAISGYAGMWISVRANVRYYKIRVNYVIYFFYYIFYFIELLQLLLVVIMMLFKYVLKAD